LGRDNALSIERELHFPHSLGLLYSAVTYYTGFKVNSGEYKVMGSRPTASRAMPAPSSTTSSI
jgi:carbamoyltransferase